MSKLRTLISIDPRLCSELLKYELTRYHEIEVVGESTNPFEILSLISHTQPHLWIHSWKDGSDLASLCSHVHSISPELVIVCVPPDEAVGTLQVPIQSFANLISKAIQLQQPVEVLPGSSYQAVS